MWVGTLTKGLMHGWVDQFATQLEVFFTKKNGQIWEITTSLHWFPPYFSMSLMAHIEFLFF